jgi:hypothetical protein
VCLEILGAEEEAKRTFQFFSSSAPSRLVSVNVAKAMMDGFFFFCFFYHLTVNEPGSGLQSASFCRLQPAIPAQWSPTQFGEFLFSSFSFVSLVPRGQKGPLC